MIEKVIHYKRVGLIKRTFISLLDIFFLVFLTLVFSLTSLGIYVSTSSFANDNEALINLKNESNLFSNNEEILAKLENDDSLTTNEKSEALDKAITKFYTFANKTLNDATNYLSDYESRKLSAKEDEVNLFIKVEDEIIRGENNIKDSVYFEFYKEEYSSFALPTLYSFPLYTSITQKVVLINLTLISVSLLISGLIIYLVFPLIFKRDHATLAMKLFKVGLINSNGVSLDFKEFIFRFLFIYIIEFILGIFSLFIIPLISYSYMILSKKEAPFHDALINIMMVDKNSNKIYLNKSEYLKEVNALLVEEN